MARNAQDMPFIRNLASSDRKIRTAALSSLQKYLSTPPRKLSDKRPTLSDVDILKLWKGLFYALWMCDRPLPQAQLCTELANLLFVLPTQNAIPWLRGFWTTMSREWTGIDVLRMEKFLKLVRKVLGASFMWMKSGKVWDDTRVDQMLDILEEWPLRTHDDATLSHGAEPTPESEPVTSPTTVPAGLKIHVVDIWLDEAIRAGIYVEEGEGDDRTEEAKQQAAGIFGRLLEMVQKLKADASSTAVKIRSGESLSDTRLPGNQSAAPVDDFDMDDDDDFDGFQD